MNDGGGAGARVAAWMIAAGAIAVVLIALPYKAFDLDRFFVPKELVLHVVALVCALAALARARRLEMSRVDTLLAAYLILGAVSAVLAPNWWLAGRALALSLSGAVVFWSARSAVRAGEGEVILGAISLAVVLAAATSLLQAYGVRTELFSINRAPGGTLGNRNFVAHLAAIGAPLLLMRTLLARGRVGAWLGGASLALVSAALVLSRSRAAWLALIACAGILAFTVLAGWRTWRAARLGPRVRLAGVAVAIGGAAALLLPNTLDWKSDSPYLDSVRGVVNYRDGSGRGRLVQYRNSVHMALVHPVLGVGPGNWPVRYPRYASKADPSLDKDDGMTSNPWPSSDWVAYLSERGLPAFACLVLALAGLGVGALLSMSRAGGADRLMPPVVLLATLVATLVVGMFDAVLLLPAPALLVWALLGALAPPARTRREIALDHRRGTAVLTALVLGGLAVAHSAAQVASMSLVNGATKRAVVERASALDPGSYRIHIRLAESYARRGQCTHVRAHAGAARALFPNAPEPRRLLAECGVRGAGRGMRKGLGR
ncbi:MAG TPA: O-antigen ligase family protein [Gemmatimonadaceae bacterium]|nr:O-antigen ligase family protein [Gemmatimonadaceae bacterium]